MEIEKVNEAGVAARSNGFAIVLRMSGGMEATIYVPLLVFRNRSPDFLTVNLSDDVVGVSYRTVPNASMDQIVFNQWLNEPIEISCDPQSRQRFYLCPTVQGTLLLKTWKDRLMLSTP